jgi:predicted DNA-binding transcriptional regulator AlpA
MTKLLTINEVAVKLRRSPGQISYMRYNGTGPKSAKMAGRVMFREEDVEKWIDDQFTAENTKAAG